MICDWMRHVGRGHFSIYELYPSIGLFLPEIPYYQVQQWIWTAVASGSNPLFLWQFKKERLGLETNDAGLVEIDGRDNPTSLDARKSFAILKKEAEDISKWKVPQAPIGIVYDLQSDLVNRLEMTNPRDGDYVGRYDLRYRLPGGHAYKANLQGTYHLFWLNNLHADIVSSQRLGEVVDQYKLLYLPSLYAVDQERADLLYRFVEQGGTLIADAGFARRDSNTWLHPTRPGSGLSELFGYWEEFCAIEPSLREKCRLESGSELETGHERITFKTNKAIPCGWWKDDGTPAAVTGTIGKGRFLMLGFSPGISYLLGTQTQWPEYLRQIIVDWGGIQRPFWGPNAVPGVTLRRVIDKNGRQITFAFRRWGKEVAMEDAQWSNWSVPESNLLFELSHVKCFVSK
jgi:beta-galactosidase GanA